jgi:predicted nucleic acid-binding protein
MRFFDASALVKRYIREPGSVRVRRLLQSGDGVVPASEVEVVSAFARLMREGAISAAQRDTATAAFVADLSAWLIVELQADVTKTARRLLLQYPLRAGDALQLGAALALQDAVSRPLEEFVAYDVRLLNAARCEQFVVRSR